MGARAHQFILKYIDQLEGAIVEIGAGRGEGSTDFFAGLVVGCTQFTHYSVDFDSEAYSVMKQYSDRIDNCHAYCLTGEEFLRNRLDEKICYAYLDNFDYIYDPDNLPWWVEGQIKRYQELGVVMNNTNSQHAHLLQAQLCVKKAQDHCVIQLDDTFKRGNTWTGKGGTAVPYLVDQGWKIVYTHEQSVALINF